MIHILILSSCLFISYLSNPYLAVFFFLVFFQYLCTRNFIFIETTSSKSSQNILRNKNFIFIFLFTIFFILASGNYISSFLNLDWELRATLVNDLVNNKWPIIYEDIYHLRTSLGFYLIPALVGKFFCYDLSIFFIYFVYLIFFLSIFQLLKFSISKFSGFIFFSGPDVIGILITKIAIFFSFLLNIVPDNFLNYFSTFKIGTHLEWWANTNQISSNFTLLSWVPNHSLMTIFFTLVLIYYRNKIDNFITLSFISLLSIVWSPFSFIAILSVLFLLIKKSHFLYFINNFRKYLIIMFLVGIIICLCLIFYYSDFDLIPSRINLIGPFTIPMNILLILVEIVFPIFVFVRHRMLRIFLLKLGILIFLFSFINIGLSNDFFMRSIVGITTIYYFFLSREFVFYVKKNKFSVIKWFLIIPFIFTSFQEVSRVIINEPKAIDFSKNVYTLTDGQFHHYYIKK